MEPMSSHEPTTAELPDRQRRRWPWWHRQTTTTRRVVRTSLAAVLTLLVSVTVGLFTASADSSLGPHRAHYSVTPHHEVALDLGPLGAVLLDSPLPWPLGVEVMVEEIPAELAVDTSPISGLANDISAYAQVASQPQAAVAEAVTLLVRDAVGRTVVIWSVLLVGIAVGRFASRGLMRRELFAAARRPGVLPLSAVVVLSLVAMPVTSAVRDRHPEGTTISALAGTDLAGLRMTGRMAQLLDIYGGYLVEALEENETFYAEVSENLEVAYEASRAPRRPPSIPIISPTPQDSTDGDAADDDVPATAAATDVQPPESLPAETEDGAGPDDVDAEDIDSDDVAADAADSDGADGDAADTETEDAEEFVRREPVTLLLVSDLHCNVGMAPVIADVARLSGASAVLDGGDTAMSGTSVESYCVNAFAGALPDDLPLVVSTGNHDSVLTAEQMEQAGYTVLDGEPVEVAGVRLLGDTDPTLTSVGEGTKPERDETIPEMGGRLAQQACRLGEEETPVDILLVHNPVAAEDTLEAGCAPLSLSGHWHRRVGPEPAGQSVRYVNGSTGGASGGLTVGPLNGSAELTVLRYDVGRGEPMDYRVITIDTEANVDLGRWYRFPPAFDTTDPAPDRS